MSDLNSLNIETVRSFMLSRGGKVTNHELVKHFKSVLTNAETRDEARVKFKEIVNTLATIARDAEGGKQLTLRKKYRAGESAAGHAAPRLELPTELNLQYTPVYHSPTAADYPDLSRRASQDSLFSAISFKSPLSGPSVFSATPSSPQGSLPGTPLSGTYLSQQQQQQQLTPTGGNHGMASRRESAASLSGPPLVEQPPVTAPPFQLQLLQQQLQQEQQEVLQQQQQLQQEVQQQQQQEVAQQHDPPPPVPPRRRSSDKIRQDMEEAENKENKENIAGEDNKVSVKERSQEFDRMASEVALRRAPHPNKKRQEKDKDEEDGVTALDSKSRMWIVRCAQGDYQTLAKLAADNPKLVKFKETPAEQKQKEQKTNSSITVLEDPKSGDNIYSNNLVESSDQENSCNIHEANNKECACKEENLQLQAISLEEELKNQGLMVKKVKEACLFRALADQVFCDQDMHAIVRKNCMDYISLHIDYFSEYIHGSHVHTYHNKKRFDCLNEVYIELHAVSEIYNRTVEIYRYGDKPLLIHSGEHMSVKEPIRITYQQGGHYNSVVKFGASNVNDCHDKWLKDAIRESDDLQIEQAMLDDKLGATDREATNQTIEQQVVRDSYLQYLKEVEKSRQSIQRDNNGESNPSSDSVQGKESNLGSQEWKDSGILSQIIAESQQEYLDSLKKSHRNSSNDIK